MNELYQVHDTHGRPKIADNIYCFQLPSPEPVVWRANSTVWSCTSQLTALQPDPPTQSPIHDVASSNPSCVTYPTGRLSAWPASVLFRSWRMLECKFTTQDHRCPWVSASSNNRLGSSIWAAIISARYCFVYFGSRMETLLHFARRRKLFVEEGEWCCASDNTELAGVDDHRVSYFLSLCPQDVVFWNAGR